MKKRLARLWQTRRHQTANSGQCSVCQGWFDNWPGGICAACQNNGHH